PSDLQMIVNRCPGQGETTSDGTGCFRVSFNKVIWGPSFDEDDLILDGGGSISSFTQIDNNLWEVQVSGILPGATLTLLLGADSVQDYSAVLNSTAVLGVNTIRYELAPSSDPS